MPSLFAFASRLFSHGFNKYVVVGDHTIFAFFSLRRVVRHFCSVDTNAVVVDVEMFIFTNCHSDVLVVVVEDVLVLSYGLVLVVGLLTCDLFTDVLAVLEELVERVLLVVLCVGTHLLFSNEQLIHTDARPTVIVLSHFNKDVDKIG